MATDDQVFRLTWVFDGKRFTADLSEAAANAISKMASVEDADVKLTNVTVQNVRKRSDAQRDSVSSTKAAADAQVQAANAQSAVFGPATERVVTSINRQAQALDRLRRTYDPLSAAVISAQKDVDKATDIINRNGVASKEGAEAVGLLAAAMQRLSQAQAAKTVTSSTQLGGMDVVIRQYNEALDASQRYARSGLDPIIAKHQEATASARNMARELAAVDAAFREGVIGQQQYVLLNEKIVASYDLGAAAAKRFAEEQARLTAGARSQQNAANAQQFFNEQLGVDAPVGRSARESAAFFEELANAEKQVENASITVEGRFTELTAKFDPTTASISRMIKEISDLNEAQRLGVNIAGGYASALEQIKTKFGQLTEAQIALQQAQSRSFGGTSAQANQARATAAGPGTVAAGQNENAAQIAANNQAAFNRLLGVNQQVTKSAQDSAAAFEAEFSNMEKLSRIADGYRLKLNPLIDAQTQYRARIAEVNELTKAKLLTDREAQIILGDFVAREQAVTVALQKANAEQLTSQQISKQFKPILQQASKDFTDFKDTTNRAFGLNRIGFLELQAAGINTFQSLAAGISPLRTAETEGAQVVGALIQGNLLTLRSLIAFAAPIAAVAAGFALVVARIITVNSNLREFQIQLDTVGRGSGATAAGLQRVVDDLQKAGFAAADAKKSIEELLKLGPQGLIASQENIQKIANLGLNISAQTGANPADEVIALGKALTSGGDAIRKYADERGVFIDQSGKLRESLLNEVIAQTQLGNTNKVAAIVIRELTTLYDGKYRQSLSGVALAFHDVAIAYRDFLKTITESSTVQTVLTGIANYLKKDIESIGSFITFLDKAITTIGDTFNKVYDYLKRLTDLLPSIPEWVKNLASNPIPAEGSRGLPPTAISARGNQGIPPSGADIARSIAQNIPLEGAGFGTRAQREEFTPGKTPTSLQETLAEAGKFPGLGAISGNVPFPTQGQTRSASAADAQFVGPTTEQRRAAAEWNKLQDDRIKGLIPLGIVQRVVQAGIEAENKAALAGIDISKDTSARDRAHATELAAINLEVQHALELQNLETQGKVRSIEATTQSESAGLRSLAIEKARIDVITQGGDVQRRANVELQTNAAAAVLASRQQLAAQEPVLARQDALAAAALKGAAAEHEQVLENEAHARTYDVLLKATAAYEEAQKSGTAADVTRTKVLQDLAKKEDDLAVAQAQRADRAQQNIDLGRVLQSNKDQVDILKLQVSLQGETNEEITKRTALLQTGQTLQEKYNRLLPEQKQEWIDSVTQVQNFNIALVQAQRAQERLNQLFVGIGETISNSLGQALQDAFSGTKTEAWGTRLKRIISEIMTQITQFALIRPLIGSALGAIGLQQAAQTFGTFGGATGATGGGGLGLGGISQGLGLVKDVGGGGSLFGEGGFSNWLNKLGSNIGFSQPLAASGPGGLTAAELADLGVPTTTSGLFGGTSLTGLLGSIGAGVGAGGLLASLTGGNPTLGSVGGGLGGIAGGILGPLLGLTGPIGGILGGLVGGLGGLFGNNRPSNNASGGNVNLLTGAVSGISSGGVAANDQNVQQITNSLSSFAKSIQQITGGTVGTTLAAVQAGSRDAIKIDFGDTQIRAQDAATAINESELKIAKSLIGISDTMKTIIAATTDPAQLQANLAFAATYDSLKTAADSAFSSISTDTQAIGPFATALNTIKSTFADLTDKATQFGLSLEPVNAGLAEATKRLQDDFVKALDQALNAAGNTDFLNKLTTASETFASNIREAGSLGIANDPNIRGKINLLEFQQAQAVLSTLSKTDLQSVVDTLGKTNPEIATMAQEILNAGTAATSAGASLQTLAQGIKTLEDTAKTLTTGPLAGLSPQRQLDTDRAAFLAQLGIVQGAGKGATGDQLTILSTLATTAIQNAQTNFGNTPRTGDLRREILADINAVLAVVGTAGAAGGIQVPPNVTAAQAQAAAFAVGAATISTNDVTINAQTATTVTSPVASTLGLPGFAGGGTTPAGHILVGEKGPEWMLVGRRGPEVINHGGGAMILPFPQRPGRSFAEGTGDLPAMTFAMPVAPAMSRGDGSLLAKIDELKAEVVALRRQTQGGQADASEKAKVSNIHLGEINSKIASPISEPRRQRLG